MNRLYFVESFKPVLGNTVDYKEVMEHLLQSNKEYTKPLSSFVFAVSQDARLVAVAQLEDNYHFLKLFYKKSEFRYLESIEDSEIHSLLQSFNKERKRKIRHLELSML